MANNGRLMRAAVTFVTPAAAMATVAALPLAPAQAQAPGADLHILSPRAGDSLGANSFNLDVSFQSRSKSPVVTAELWVDGVRWVRRDLDAPQVKNVLSFDVDTQILYQPPHRAIRRQRVQRRSLMGQLRSLFDTLAANDVQAFEGMSVSYPARLPDNVDEAGSTVKFTLGQIENRRQALLTQRVVN